MKRNTRDREYCVRVLECGSRGLYVRLRARSPESVSTTARTVLDLPVVR